MNSPKSTLNIRARHTSTTCRTSSLVGESASDLKQKVLKAGRIVGAEVRRLKLTLSEKSTLLPDNQNTRSIAKTLCAEDICLKTATTCDDVGVQMSGSGVRKASSLNFRIEVKGKDRAKRTRALVMVQPAAIKLTMAGTHPVQVYSHQAQGASQSQMVGMGKILKIRLGMQELTLAPLPLLLGNLELTPTRSSSAL